MNIKFSLFIFSVENYEQSNVIEILNKYIDKDNKNYYYFRNEKERIKKQNSLQSFRESIFYLNKIDNVDKKDRALSIIHFRKYIEKNYIREKIELNRYNQISGSARLLNMNNSKLDSFYDYLFYLNSISNHCDLYTKSFYKYIVQMMNKDFKLNIQEESDNDDESDNEESNNKKKLEYIKLKGIVNNNKDFIQFISYRKYIELRREFKKNKNKYENKENDDDIKIVLKNKMKNIIENYLNIDQYSGMISEITKELNININENKREKLINKNINNLENPIEFLKNYRNYINTMNALYNNNNQRNKIIDIIDTTINSLINYFLSIRFLLIGPHNSGKSSILNNLIGYNQYLLPSKLQECTKMGVIIKYTEKKENTKMYKAFFSRNNDGNYFEYNEYNIISYGEYKIYKKLDELNNKENAKEDEFKFYMIETPIEFFDKMWLPLEIKKRIELIDFPGLDTDFIKAKKNANDLLKMIDGFIYVNYQITFDSDNYKILTSIYNTIKQRNIFSLNTCLFIFNKIDKLEGDNNEFNIEEISQKILKIFDDQNKSLLSTEVIDQKRELKIIH